MERLRVMEEEQTRRMVSGIELRGKRDLENRQVGVAIGDCQEDNPFSLMRRADMVGKIII